MNTQDKYSISLGQVSNSYVNPTTSSGFSNMNVDIANQTVPGDNVFGVPTAMPYGFMSSPTPGSFAVMGNIASSHLSPVVLGFIPNNSNLFATQGLQQGESALYNEKYSLIAKLTGLTNTLNNAQGQFTCTQLYGENIIKVLIDILTQLLTLYNTDLSNIWTQLNNHTHKYEGTNTTESMEVSGTTITNPTISSTIESDKTDLEAGKGYVNDTGELML